MTLGQRVKNLRGRLIYHSGLFQARLRRMHPSQRLALMYHRILPRSEAGRFLEPGMYVEPETFETHLQFLKDHFSPCRLEEFLKPGQESARPRCLVTFDDGWEDFYRYAFPRLVDYGVPATLFLPTGYVGTGKRFWSERLAAVLERAQARQEIAALEDFLRCRLGCAYLNLGSGAEGFSRMVRVLKAWREERLDSLLQECENRFGVSPRYREDFLRWDQVDEIRRSGLVTFGSHGVSHRLFPTLNPGEVEGELGLSRAELVAHDCGGADEMAFCYPNGDFTAASIALLDRLGFACAFTTRMGWNSDQTPRFELRRIGVHQDVGFSRYTLLDRIYFGVGH